MRFSVDEFNNLSPADKLRKLNEELKNDKQIQELKNICDLFPDLNGKI